MTPRKANLFFLAFSISCALLASAFFLPHTFKAFPLDDAYIHLSYARNLATGKGFAFNPEEPGFGTSSPLWVLLLALFFPILEPHLLVRLICIICLGANFYFCSLIIWHQIQSQSINTTTKFFISLLPSLVLGFSGNFLWLTFSGMESILFSTIGLASIFALIRKRTGTLEYILPGLLCLVRLEAVLLIPLIFVWQWFYAEDRKRNLKILLSIIIPLTFHSWAYFHLGSFFPTTRAGKLASNLFNSGISIKGGWIFLKRHLHYLWLTQPEIILALGFILIIWSLFKFYFPRKMKPSLSPSSILGVFALLIFLYHDQFFRSTQMLTPYHNLRYQVLFFPFLALTISQTILQIVSAGIIKKWQQNIIYFFLLLFLIASFYHLKSWRILYQNQVRHIWEVHQKAALWVKDNLPATSRIACFDIGSLGFYSERYIIDLGGLIDPAIYPYFKERNISAYLKKKNATHYIEMGTPGSERMLGVKKELGKLYQLKPLAYFAGQRIREPVLLHSWEMKIFQILWQNNKNEP